MTPESPPPSSEFRAPRLHPLRLLVVEDSPRDAEIVVREIRNGGFDVTWKRVETEAAMRAALDAEPWDAVIADYRLPHFDGLLALRVLQEKGLDLPFIIVSGTIGEETAVATMKAGAHDYLMKNNLARLAPALERELRDATTRTESKRAEEVLRESEIRYRTLADSGQALIWASGLDKKCDYFNQPWLKFTGRTFEHELGDGWAEGVHPDDQARCLEIYTTAFDRRERFSMDYRLRRHDGEFRWIQDDGSPRCDSHGNFLGYIGHCLDITERKRDEEKKVKQLDELRRWQTVTLGREGRIGDLKREVNTLATRLGEKPRYGSVEAN